MKMWAIGLVIICSVLAAIGQVFLKKGADGFQLVNLMKNYPLVIGILFYGVSFVLYMFALRFEKVTILYPVISLAYVWVMLLASVFLNEPLVLKKMFGAMIIILGVTLIAK